MTSENSKFVFLAGDLYRTRDRREARIDRIESGGGLPDSGLITGQVQMHGPCVWLTGGRYRDAPFGAPGPLDLMPPSPEGAERGEPKTASLKEALEADNRLFCCD
jgi:hypothetical protein